MKYYKFKIIANKLGAIGKRQKFTKVIIAENEEDAVFKLYDTFERITIVSTNGKKQKL